MATSGSTDHNRSRAQIVARALRQLGVIEAGETPTAEDDQTAVEALNGMVKGWLADGIHLWTRREATLFVTPSQASYQLGPSSSDHAAEDTEIARSTLSAAEASGQTILSITSTAGMTAADQFGVVLDDDTLHWTTISTVDSSIQVTVAAGLPSDAASGNKVYAYTNALGRPLQVIDARRRDETSDQDTPIITNAHKDYQRLPNKTEEGETNIVYYHPLLTRGTLFCWPVPNTVDRTLRLSCVLPIEDFDAAGDDPDFPQEWIAALSWNLAEELITEFAVPPEIGRVVLRQAAKWYDKALMWDQEPESVYFQPNMTHVGGN